MEPGTENRCPGKGCGRWIHIKSDGTIASHYRYGTDRCPATNQTMIKAYLQAQGV